MSDVAEQIALSGELLQLLRGAANHAVGLREPFVTMRALLLAMLDDPQLGKSLQDVIPREKLEEYEVDAEAAARMTASRISETGLQSGERAALLRFNTLAFKTEDGSRSVWLSREAHTAFLSGAQRVSEGCAYLPLHLAQGIAADAVRAPGLLTALKVEPGAVIDAVMKL